MYDREVHRLTKVKIRSCTLHGGVVSCVDIKNLIKPINDAADIAIM